MLTKKQQEVLNFIHAFRHKQGIAPTMREIAHALDFASPATACKHVQTLKRKGHLQNMKGWRALVQAEQPHTMHNASYRVSVIGTLSRETNIELFHTMQYRDIFLPHLHTDKTHLYGFIIKDSSFIDRLLCAGDLLVVQTQTTPLHGSSVLCEIPQQGITIQEYDATNAQTSKVRIHGVVIFSCRYYASSSEDGSKSFNP